MPFDVTRLTDLLIGDEYAKALASYQIERGWNRMDLTPEQTLRFRALEKAHGSSAGAKRLMFGRLRRRQGEMTDGKR